MKRGAKRGTDHRLLAENLNLRGWDIKNPSNVTYKYRNSCLNYNDCKKNHLGNWIKDDWLKTKIIKIRHSWDILWIFKRIGKSRSNKISRKKRYWTTEPYKVSVWVLKINKSWKSYNRRNKKSINNERKWEKAYVAYVYRKNRKLWIEKVNFLQTVQQFYSIQN